MPAHPGSIDTFNALSTGKDGLERFRILYDFGQYILNGVGGDILEIGVGESSYFLSRLAEKFKRRIYHCDISPSKIVNPMTVDGYLSHLDESTYIEEGKPVPTISFKRAIYYAGPSDDFFKKIPISPIAFAFIDGDHRYEQAARDFWQTWDLLVPEGVIAMHDTYPPDETWIDENHCGDVYKLRQELESTPDIDCLTVGKGCVIGVGVTFVKKRRKEYKYG